MPRPVFSAEIIVRWSDMDAFGHVNNSKFFSYFETARIAWWDSSLTLALDESGPVLINASCTFLKPIIYPETILVEVSVGEPGRSSHECYYRVTSKKNPSVLYAEGATKVVWVDRRSGKSVALPEALKNLLIG
jgi:acyl-CoA thioester hydrolase